MHSASIQHLQQQLQQAIADNQPVSIIGNGSKSFLSGLKKDSPHISTASHRGILSYEADELVIQVKSGSLVSEINQELAKHHQRLSFEPPHFNQQATIGGVVASALCGTSQPWAGAVKDYLLGVSILNARAQINRFGGQVFKNVAGFDAFRPQAGAWGSLGVILDVSLRLNPSPKSVQYLSIECQAEEALKAMIEWQKQPLPLSSLCWQENTLYLRLSGLNSAIKQALTTIQKYFNKANIQSIESHYWQQLQQSSLPSLDQSTDAHQTSLLCWQVPTAEKLKLNDLIMLDWGGSKRWYSNTEANKSLYQQGFWQIYPLANKNQAPPHLIVQPLSSSVQQLQARFIQAFDPKGRFICHVR